MGTQYKLALCQMYTIDDKKKNMETAADFVNRAAAGGAKVVSLPEMWNTPYDNSFFPRYAEDAEGPSVVLMADLARTNEVYLIGGSIPERQGEKLYNTSYIFAPDGQLLAKHRKIYLFDINVTGGVRFMESDTLTAGDSETVIDTEFGKIGVAICFDVRFPPLFRSMTDKGVHLVILPASFSLTTGPVHWDLLMRSRALDNQIYFAACSPARDVTQKYRAYGHSCVVDPWGEFCGMAALGETIVYADINLDYMARVRREIPIGFEHLGSGQE
ncbi:MAG: carbon-nitrogen hydrolase family protein [Clostridiales Family XIII bacterium]|jgi:predicted amidohydrolase|nr:carbon-nitrogen hydrolase family protein [Clostridiales Family XIII bacterium]